MDPDALFRDPLRLPYARRQPLHALHERLSALGSGRPGARALAQRAFLAALALAASPCTDGALATGTRHELHRFTDDLLSLDWNDYTMEPDRPFLLGWARR